MAILDGSFFLRDTIEAARDLLGQYLVRETARGRIVCRITETEAYVGAVDKACHAYGGRVTERTRTLYGPPGTIYVYLIYGMYHCLNVVTEEEGTAAAVLIRGGEIVRGRELAAAYRFGTFDGSLTAARQRILSNGPGKLCKALNIDRSLNNLPVASSPLYFSDEIPELSLQKRQEKLEICVGKRIGIDYAQEAAEFPWRFWLE